MLQMVAQIKIGACYTAETVAFRNTAKNILEHATEIYWMRSKFNNQNEQVGQVVKALQTNISQTILVSHYVVPFEALGWKWHFVSRIKNLLNHKMKGIFNVKNPT